jgi:hypothetical protein
MLSGSIDDSIGLVAYDACRLGVGPTDPSSSSTRGGDTQGQQMGFSVGLRSV